jgi:hypothetical protein
MTRSPARQRSPAGKLTMRSISFDKPDQWLRDASNLLPLVSCLEGSGVKATPLVARSVVGKPITLTGWAALADWLRESGASVYEIDAAAAKPALRMTLNVTTVSLVIECTIAVDAGAVGAGTTMLRELLEGFHAGYCRRALVGPVLAITLQNVDYARPRKQHNHKQWLPGAIMLGACERFFASRGPAERGRLAMLERRSLPAGLSRRKSGDLLVIATEATEGMELSRQRTLLEEWIGDTLALPLDEDFDRRGDKRIIVAERERAGQMGFYDPGSKTLFKAAPEMKGDDLDAATRKRLEDILRRETLPDGRAIRAKRIVFIGRPAAIRWLPWVAERGGTVAYLDTDGQMWDPAPEGSPQTSKRDPDD